MTNDNTNNLQSDAALDEALASLAPGRPPARDLWQGIESRLDTQPVTARRRSPWRYAMAASMVGVLVGGLVLVPKAPEQAPITIASGPSPETAQAEQPWEPMLATFRQAERAIRTSAKPVAASPSNTPDNAQPLAGTLELERAINKLEAQSAELREQLKTDPNDIDNIQTLARVERRRLELIRLITELDQAPDGGFSNADASF